MQNAALRAAGLHDWRYQLLPVPPELLAETVSALAQAGFRGANVTIPHKQTALALADRATSTAAAIGAANTLTFEQDGAIVADNTDAPGLIEALPLAPEGKTALVLGAGGSARAAVWALRNAGAEQVRVWNRTPERAAALCEELGCAPTADVEPADLLVNCTAAGMDGRTDEFKDLPLKADEVTMFRCVVDLAYTHADTSLVRAARRHGLPVADGLDVLVAQGALSFERFTGIPAQRDVMRAAVRGR
jgi:shikimate dehydrogenase